MGGVVVGSPFPLEFGFGIWDLNLRLNLDLTISLAASNIFEICQRLLKDTFL